MAKPGPSRSRPLMLRLTALAHALLETRSPPQKPACKDLDRNGQTQVITVKSAYTPVSNRGGERS